MRSFDWNLVKSFLAVVDAGSLSAAAAASGASQPTLGRHIDELEAISGLVLFERGRAGMRPTQAALALVDEARDMAREADRFALVASGREQSVAGTVRITASAIVSTYVLPPVLAALRRAEPAIEIELVSSNDVQNLLSRDADIAIRMVRPTQNELIARHANEFAMGCYARRDYLAAFGTPQTVEALLAHTLVGYDRSDVILNAMRRLGIAGGRENFALRTDDQVANFELVKAGAGIGFGPRFVARKTPELVRLLPDLPIPALPMWLASHRELHTSLRIRRTADFIFEALRALPLAA